MIRRTLVLTAIWCGLLLAALVGLSLMAGPVVEDNDRPPLIVTR